MFIILLLFLFLTINGLNLNNIIIIVLLLIGIFVLILFHLETPKAIDVYRGKTKLEITYKDGVAIDSTVIFKNK